MLESYSKRLAMLAGIFHGVRLFSGAIHALFLIKRGVTLSELAFFQIIFSATILLCSYPSGILTDYYGAKKLVFLSCFFVAIYNFLCLFAPHILTLSIAHVFHTLGLLFASVALPSWITRWSHRENHKNQNYINSLGHLENEIQSVSCLISGCLGAIISFFLDDFGYICVYLLTTASMVFFCFLFWKIPPVLTNNSLKVHFLALHSRKNLKSIFLCNRTLLFICAAAFITGIYQPVFHFWQPLLKEINSFFVDENLVGGICFFFLNLARYIFNRHMKILSQIYLSINFFLIALFSFFLSGIIFVSLGLLSNENLIAIALFSILHGFLSIGSKIINSQYLKYSSEKNTGSVLSIAEFLGRILSIFILFIIYYVIPKIGVQGIFFFTGYCILPILVIVYLWNLLEKKGKQRDVEISYRWDT